MGPPVRDTAALCMPDDGTGPPNCYHRLNMPPVSSVRFGGHGQGSIREGFQISG